ncbi:sialidase family protein [Paenibacillus ginsengarvi]|uniref:Exo-alpha-sialidase n=1 Tax=Paenibacillus ginsengarvi TaxID=400777 RepID=A0A3B0CSW9_9BACL|nr:sialidase family protein [Paenibacillus ginsengarvi]RKN86327.1 exo-alpha-sialidase [Paenibacillus ginsengarvi]
MTIKPIAHMALYKDEQYNTFPSIVRNAQGTYITAFRQAPDRLDSYGLEHIDPSSKAVYVTSEDGVQWSRQSGVVYDDYFYGVQDPCLNVLKDGTVFATIFMWKVAEQEDVSDQPDFSHRIFGRWAGKAVGAYTLRSTDGGITWDRPIAVSLKDVYIRGNVAELDDGSLLAPFYGYEDGTWSVVVGRTNDRGLSWTRHAVIDPEEGYGFFEPNLYVAPSGKIVLFTRCHKTKPEQGDGGTAYPLVTAESGDGGLTWSRPVKRRFYSPSPFHVLRLESGQVLLSYGYRFKPFGIRAALLDPECGNLEQAEEVIVRDDGHGSDIGYTSAVQLEDGRVLITYYFSEQGERRRYIAGTICEIG